MEEDKELFEKIWGQTKKICEPLPEFDDKQLGLYFFKIPETRIVVGAAPKRFKMGVGILSDEETDLVMLSWRRPHHFEKTLKAQLAGNYKHLEGIVKFMKPV